MPVGIVGLLDKGITVVVGGKGVFEGGSTVVLGGVWCIDTTAEGTTAGGTAPRKEAGRTRLAPDATQPGSDVPAPHVLPWVPS